MYKKGKKGFTIVELVIVVAVIGVLTAILVPTFVNLTNKANNAADESLVKNLNTQLRMKEQTEGKNKTLADALKDAKEAGYLVENLTPKGDQDILWNQEADEFVFGDKATGELYKYWKIYERAADVPATQTYSIYAKGKTWSGDFTYTVGFDAGENEGVGTITYVKGEAAKSDVRMRTNGGSLVVNADTDVVSHWSYIDKVDIQAVKGDSYHEYGIVRVGMEVSKGHVVVESEGYVNELTIPEDATGISVKVEPKGEVKTAVIDSTEAAVEVAAGAEVGQVVGETGNITGAGAAEAKEGAVIKHEVATAEELQAALDDGEKYIVVTEDFSAASNITVTKDVTIDGGNHTIASSGATRLVWIDENDVSLSIKNLVLDSAKKAERGLQANTDVTGYNIKLENVKIINNTYYAINMCSNTSGTLVAIGCEVSGWSALNAWGSGHDFRFVNSILTGTNDKKVSSWNNYATICLEADTTQATADFSSFNNVYLAGCTVNAIETNSNYQFIASFNGGSVGATGNKLITDGCEFNYARYAINGGGQGNSWTNDGEVIWSN